jgi:hypothetical protein
MVDEMLESREAALNTLLVILRGSIPSVSGKIKYTTKSDFQAPSQISIIPARCPICQPELR